MTATREDKRHTTRLRQRAATPGRLIARTATSSVAALPCWECSPCASGTRCANAPSVARATNHSHGPTRCRPLGHLLPPLLGFDAPGWVGGPRPRLACRAALPGKSRRSDSRRTLDDGVVNPHATPGRPTLGSSSAISRPNASAGRTTAPEDYILDVIGSASPSCNAHRPKIPDTDGYPLRAKAMGSPAHPRGAAPCAHAPPPSHRSELPRALNAVDSAESGAAAEDLIATTRHPATGS